jgi:hypothetical protein
MTETAVREPFRRDLSGNVHILFGFKDAHAVVYARLPIIRIWYPQNIPADAILGYKKVFDDAYTYGLKPPEERTLKDPVEIEIRSDCRCRWGFPDAHVELGVWRLKWFWINFPFEEFILAKKAMDEVHMWAELPDNVRALQGVA